MILINFDLSIINISIEAIRVVLHFKSPPTINSAVVV